MGDFINKVYRATKAGIKAGIQATKRQFDAIGAPDRQVKDFIKNDFLKPAAQAVKADPVNGLAKIPSATAITVIGLPIIFAESVITETIPGVVKNTPVFVAAKAAMKEYKK